MPPWWAMCSPEVTAMAEQNLTPSSNSNPCPICGRIEDGDCRISSELILCHWGNNLHSPQGLKPGQVIPGRLSGPGAQPIARPAMAPPWRPGRRCGQGGQGGMAAAGHSVDRLTFFRQKLQPGEAIDPAAGCGMGKAAMPSGYGEEPHPQRPAAAP